MKFAIVVLLGLCAVAANAEYFGHGFGLGPRDSPTIEPQNAVTDKIKEAIGGLLKAISEKFSVASLKVKEIMSKLKDQTGDLVVKAKERANVVKNEIQGKLNEMKQKGGEVAACAKKLEPDYIKVEKELMTDVKKCAGEVYVSSEEMKEDVSRGMAAIRSSIHDFEEAISGCMGWNPINSVQCVKEKIHVFKKIFKDILISINTAVKASQQKAVQIMNMARECNGKALENAKAQISELNKKLGQCYKHDIIYY